MKDAVEVAVTEESHLMRIDGDLTTEALEEYIEANKPEKKRPGAFYQQEFPQHVARKLTELDKMASAQRGFIRRDRQRKRNNK